MGNQQLKQIVKTACAALILGLATPALAPSPALGDKIAAYLVSGFTDNNIVSGPAGGLGVERFLWDDGARIQRSYWNCLRPEDGGCDPGPIPNPLDDGRFVRDLTLELEALPSDWKVVLIGHSFGGDSVLKVATAMGRRIDLLGVLDPVAAGGFRSVKTITPNVGYFFNRWQGKASPFPLDAWRSGTCPIQDSSRTISDQAESNHTHGDMKNAPDIQNQLQQALSRVFNTAVPPPPPPSPIGDDLFGNVAVVQKGAFTNCGDGYCYDFLKVPLDQVSQIATFEIDANNMGGPHGVDPTHLLQVSSLDVIGPNPQDFDWWTESAEVGVDHWFYGNIIIHIRFRPTDIGTRNATFHLTMYHQRQDGKGVDFIKFVPDLVVQGIGAEAPAPTPTNPGPANLLVNGSFEQSLSQGWSLKSWAGHGQASAQAGGAHGGTYSALLEAQVADDTALTQTVQVKPNTNYVLSGWVRTENVQVMQQGGTVGANVCVFGTWEHSSSLTGTNGWTYLTVAFNSGNQSQVEVAARLGYWGSVCVGQAWFDDLTLAEAG